MYIHEQQIHNPTCMGVIFCSHLLNLRRERITRPENPATISGLNMAMDGVGSLSPVQKQPNGNPDIKPSVNPQLDVISNFDHVIKDIQLVANLALPSKTMHPSHWENLTLNQPKAIHYEYSIRKKLRIRTR